ncbi:DUF1272 domain-containing protein [Leeia aquatica]|uniref:DUF1272 domain-containing protein n=1 Tax=Leeia aquatica TaxID=2725557 RepID=A0A847S7U1_9NEIS|nr:DUF1272 domain-containing protein [Leeia aquatica]NLR76014.1 DUF1272 domain-containing protein [Leeia aquatica]
MLELRPSCEHCNTALPPDSEQAMICTFECTFCTHCVEMVLHNVCPNCGGGFVPRPIRPRHNWKNGNDLTHYPASDKVVHRPVDPEAHARLREAVGDKPPARR